MSSKILKKLKGMTDDSWYVGLLKDERDKIIELARVEGITPLQARRLQAKRMVIQK